MARGARRSRGRGVQGRTDHYPAVPALGDLFADAGPEPVSKLLAEPLAWAITLHDPDACPHCAAGFTKPKPVPCPEPDR